MRGLAVVVGWAGITDELVAAGVPKDHIVLAFHPPHVREHTGYAVR